MHKRTSTDGERESRSNHLTHLLEECRMVLPGIQALFGFQLIAVFNQSFWDKLDRWEQVLHFIAIGLVALSVTLLMTPAAYHRQAEPDTISLRFLAMSTRLLSWSMWPLMLGIACDFYIIGTLILQSWMGSLALTLMLLTLILLLWFILPRLPTLQRFMSGLR
jgi:hypothetical protein